MPVTVARAYALAFSVLVPPFLVSHVGGAWHFLAEQLLNKCQKETECLMLLFSSVASPS